MAASRRRSGPRVLVAEDEALVALEMEDMLAALECTVVGPVATLDGLLDRVGEPVDCALLDINLRGRASYPAALALLERGVPVAFMTGYGEIPDCPRALADVLRLRKPFDARQLSRTIERLRGRSRAAE